MDRSDVTSIEFQQTVHGYAGGHRLIQSSVSLPLAAQRLLVILSDLSGPASVTGFDTYLTGYPVPGTDYYALARTWLAPEMERPGCVWTHTLLIRQLDLDLVPDFRLVNSLFRRPRRDDLSATYAVPVTCAVEASVNDLPLDTQRAATVLAATYASDKESPVFFQCDASIEADQLFLGIWSQQWPTLKRRFLFCSGSLSNREFGGRPFDLQAIPARLVREIRREVRPAIILDDTSAPPVLSRWLDLAVADLMLVGRTPLRSFLSRISPLDAGRHAFKFIVDLYQLAAQLDGSRQTFEEALRAVSVQYPEPYEGIGLKTALVGLGNDDSPTLISLPPKSEVLRALSTTPAHSAFDAHQLGLADEAGKLWLRNPTAALDLLVWMTTAPLNPLGEAIFHGLVKSVGPRELPLVVEHAPRLLPAVIAANPPLAAVPAVWAVSTDRQRAIVDAIAASDGVPNSYAIVSAALSAGADAAADGLWRLVGPDAVVPVLDWYDANSTPGRSRLGSTWSRILARNTQPVVDWLANRQQLSLETLAYVTRILDPRSAMVRRLGAQFWLRLIEVSNGTLAWPDLVLFKAFTFAVAVGNNGDGSDLLAARSFEVLHRAAGLDEIPYDAWQSFQSELPPLPWWQSWDYCERLRRGIVAIFIRYEWPSEAILACTNDAGMFAAILNSARDVKYGQDFFAGLAERVRTHRAKAPEGLEAVLLEKF